jgi:putative transposase
MRKLLKGQGVTPRVMITDKLRSYDAAKREIIPGVEHRSHKGLNTERRIRIWPFDDENEG